MKIKLYDPTKTTALMNEAAWLAYQASAVVGLGHLQARNTNKEEFNMAYPISADKHYIDYGFGRMMKYLVNYDITKGEISNSRGMLREDYQSWCFTYPTYLDLFNEASKNTGIKFEVIE